MIPLTQKWLSAVRIRTRPHFPTACVRPLTPPANPPEPDSGSRLPDNKGREVFMHTAIKIVLTGACVVALAWPLLFWGHPALPEDGVLKRERELHSHVYGRHELAW